MIYDIVSAWRVSSGLHTVAQTLAGGIIGLSVGQLGTLIEPYILYQTTTGQSLVKGFSFTQRLTTGNVPLALRLIIITLGAIVLYKREIFDLEKRMFKVKSSK